MFAKRGTRSRHRWRPKAEAAKCSPAVEKTESAAGTFDTHRVEVIRKRTGASESYVSREWFANGVGQVRSERVQNEHGTDAISTLLLRGYEVP